MTERNRGQLIWAAAKAMYEAPDPDGEKSTTSWPPSHPDDVAWWISRAEAAAPVFEEAISHADERDLREADYERRAKAQAAIEWLIENVTAVARLNDTLVVPAWIDFHAAMEAAYLAGLEDKESTR